MSLCHHIDTITLTQALKDLQLIPNVRFPYPNVVGWFGCPKKMFPCFKFQINMGASFLGHPVKTLLVVHILSSDSYLILHANNKFC